MRFEIASMGKKAKVIPRWAEREDKQEDPVTFFHKYYSPQIGRSQLSRTDNALYRSLLRSGSLEEAIPDVDIDAVYTGWRGGSQKPYRETDDELLQRYQADHAGLSRGDLSSVNPSLYHKIRRRGLLNQIPRKRDL